MRIPLTKYGMPQVLVYPLINIAVMLVLWLLLRKSAPGWVLAIVEILLFIVFVWQLSFFRDPLREVPQGQGFMVSPADGKVSDIEIIDDPDHIDGKAMRIGIFLSVFNVHINRVPADVRIDGKKYKEGRFINAMSTECSKVNESNDIYMTMTDGSETKLVVRQISGAIARRIVCPIDTGDTFKMGDKFGMIKYGSRTELYFPLDDRFTPIVKIGDKVRAGLTKVVQYQPFDTTEGQ